MLFCYIHFVTQQIIFQNNLLYSSIKVEYLSMKNKIASFVYALLVNIPVCFFLCITAAITGASDIDSGVLIIDFNTFNWMNILWNFLLSFVIAMLLSTFVPLTKIGRWFTHLFGVKNDTYTGNMPYRLLSTLISTLIYYVAITPCLTLLNWGLGVYTSPRQMYISLLINIPIMLLVGFVSSLINDIGAYKIAHRIDNNF